MASKTIDTPKTIGEFIDILTKYPRDSELDFYITEIYDNGSVYSTSSNKMRIRQYFGDAVEITLGNGSTLDEE